MAEQQYVEQQYVNDLTCSSNTADILRASGAGAAMQSFSAAEAVVNRCSADCQPVLRLACFSWQDTERSRQAACLASCLPKADSGNAQLSSSQQIHVIGVPSCRVVASDTGLPAAVHAVQYSQSVYGANPQQAAAAYSPQALTGLPDFQRLQNYLNQEVPAVVQHSGRGLQPDGMLQSPYPPAAADASALAPLSPRAHYPQDAVPLHSMSVARQPYAVAYEQVHVMFDPQQAAGAGSVAPGTPAAAPQEHQQVLLSTAASVSLSPPVLTPAAAAAAAAGGAPQEAAVVQQLAAIAPVQGGYGALPAAAWAAPAGESRTWAVGLRCISRRVEN